MPNTTTLDTLNTGDHFTLDDREYRITWRWSTGVEAEQVASWGPDEPRILPPTTTVEI